MKLGVIVEGHGDEAAVPILLRRVFERSGIRDVEILRPHRVARSKIVKHGELERVVELVARKAGPGAPILVLLDADRDCPATLGPALLARSRRQRSDREHSVVLANHEFEAWFVAALASLRGQRGLSTDAPDSFAPEEVSGAKEWLSRHMARRYSETLDQAAFAATMDLDQATRAPSFDKLRRDLVKLFGAPG